MIHLSLLLTGFLVYTTFTYMLYTRAFMMGEIVICQEEYCLISLVKKIQ